MKKIIILFLILSILLLGCKSYTKTNDSLARPNSPAIGGGCGVIENQEETKIKYISIQAGL